MGLAATQGGGLTVSFGTMAKPFHAGKAAMNAVIAIGLARAGFTASSYAFDGPGSLTAALIQDVRSRLRRSHSAGWQILQNTFKPLCVVPVDHPSIDCARDIHRVLDGDRVPSASWRMSTRSQSSSPARPIRRPHSKESSASRLLRRVGSHRPNGFRCRLQRAGFGQRRRSRSRRMRRAFR